MKNEEWQKWFEGAWEYREERLYLEHFGKRTEGIYVLEGDLFTEIFKQSSYDPRWLTYGIIEFEPTDKRSSWAYVSSGLSNAWEADEPEPSSQSGLGCEFILQSNSRARWAIVQLQRMVAFQILLNAGRFPGKPPLGLWNRIPLRAAIDGKDSAITWVMVTPRTEFGGVQQIPSGQFQFHEFVGITEDEAEYARAKSGDALYELLKERRAAPVTDPSRKSVLST